MTRSTICFIVNVTSFTLFRFASIVESNKCDLQVLPMFDYLSENDQVCFMSLISVNDKTHFINVFKNKHEL